MLPLDYSSDNGRIKKYLQNGVEKLGFFFLPSILAENYDILRLSISKNCVLLLTLYTSRNGMLTHRPFIHPPGKSVFR